MIEVKTKPRQPAQDSIQERIGKAVLLIYQVIALVVFVATLVLAIRWFQTPFIGAFVEHTLVTNGIGPRNPSRWSAFHAGLDKFGYQVTDIDGQPVRTSRGLQQALRSHQVGETIPITAISPTGERETFQITLQRFPLADRIVFFLIPFVIGLVYLGSGLWVFNLRRHDTAGRAFAVFATSVAIGLGTLFDLYSSHRFAFIWNVSLVLGATWLFIMALVFPEEVEWARKRPYLRWIPTVAAILLLANTLPTLYNLNNPTAYSTAFTYEYIFLTLGVLAFLVGMIIRHGRTRSPIIREQARIIMIGAMISFFPLIAWASISVFRPGLTFLPIYLLFLTVFPIATSYSILRYRIVKTDYIFSRAVLYALLSVIAVTIYVLIVWGGSLILDITIQANNPIVIGLVVFIFAAVFNPIRLWLQEKVDNVFFRGQTIYQKQLQNFSRELTQKVDLPEIISLMRSYIDKTLSPIQIHIFSQDPVTDQYTATTVKQDDSTTDIRFSNTSTLAQILSTEQTSVFIWDPENPPSRLTSEQSRLALLGAQLFVALPGKDQVAGWLALGARRSGEPYGTYELEFLESVCDQAAMAIERAQVVHDLERRVRELNVLSRVAQGINVTLKFDDILELIYAQTYQVLRAQYFRITLYDDHTQNFYHAFYLENDDRLSDYENQPIPDGYGLEQDVIRGQRAIITQDYEQACRNRGIVPSGGIFAWVGVPLNTGNKAIGAISLGSSDPSVVYTQEQQNILQAIADQAAGAIVKTRLLQESEERARQLASLNQVARSLTSMLDIDPLLQQILESAVDILNCEAGSLLLVDEQTDELIFEVTVGPVAEDLVGKRLAPGTGLVGRAVETRLAIINNNVQTSKDWFEETDKETGFVTRALLVVPMQIRDQVIGVIEIINRKDGSPFDPDDERLLTAFSAQAAVAIQNARLFTMTDQALAERVEELSVMQRIDRELNATLDVGRSMQITLDWAMRQSDVEAGLVSIIEVETVIEDETMRVMVSEGYDIDFDLPNNAQAVSGLPIVKESLKSGQPQRQLEPGEIEASHKLLPTAQSQLVIPIRQRDIVIGLVLLESKKPNHFSDENLAFLVRLCEHASIAISNAQLYSEVQAANIAKSDFVSFVSHELKTPMTSIKGYTDLLLGGAVGPMSDPQSGFLQTIRSNVDRMTTLVSDLTDISRIEAGRLRLEFGAVPLTDVIDEVVRSTRGQIDEKEQTLELEVSEELPMVWGDRTRLIQVLTNLVSNAYKYTPEGGHITIQARQIEDSHNGREGAPDVIQVAVRDNGIGINPEDQKNIFTKFFRSEDQKAREAPGTGLGLNITKNLVEMQGGEIWFESEYRKGTTFYITIPVAETE